MHMSLFHLPSTVLTARVITASLYPGGFELSSTSIIARFVLASFLKPLMYGCRSVDLS